MDNNIIYHIAQSKEDFDACKEIISEYLETLGIDLAYMDVAKEFSSIEQKYAGNEGVLILAIAELQPIGCVGVRRIDAEIAELKRLYVRASHRGGKIGLTLLNKALEEAHSLGYKKIRLDVIPTLQKAKELYLSMGFCEIPAYFNNPIQGTTFMEKDLNSR